MTKVSTMESSSGELKKPPFGPSAVPLENTRNENEETETVPGTVRNWATDTSAHGFPNIVRSLHIVRKVFWTVVVLAGCGVTIYQVYELFVAFYSYPVTISLNLTATNALRFPTISFCNVNPVRKSALGLVDQHLAHILPISYGGNDTSILRSHAGRTEVKEKFFAAYTQLDDETKFKIGHQKQDMLLDCSFDGIKCSVENFTQFTNPHFGNCYIFNSGWNGSEVLLSHKSGEEYGLTLEMYLEQNEYLPELTESAGLRVSVTPQNIMPFPQDESVLVSPGELTFISITMLNISRLPNPYPSDCWKLTRAESASFSVYSEHYDVQYSLAACQKSCYQSHVISRCGCGDPTFPMTGQAAMKFAKDKSASISVCKEVDEPCEDQVKSDYVNSKLACNCGVPCVDVSYDPKSSSSKWPNEVFAEIYYQEIVHENPHLKNLLENRNNVNNPSYPESNLAKVQIFFADLNYEAIGEQKAYTPSSLLADIGGMLGLYLGLSMVALFEFIELLFDISRVGLGKICTK